MKKLTSLAAALLFGAPAFAQIVNNGSGGTSTITANSTPSSGFSAGQFIYSDGTKLQAAQVLQGTNLVSNINASALTTAQDQRWYYQTDTVPPTTNYAYAQVDPGTTANTLKFGSYHAGAPAQALTKFELDVDGYDVYDYGVQYYGVSTFGAPTGFQFSTGAAYRFSITPTNVALSFAEQFGWSASTSQAALDTILTRCGVACLQLGAADSAAPVAETFGVDGVIAGTANTAGQNWTIQDSSGTGTGVGGNIVIQTTPADFAHAVTGFTGSASPYTITFTPGAIATYPAGTIMTVAGCTTGTLNGSYTVTSSSSGQVVATTTATGTGSPTTCTIVGSTSVNPYGNALVIENTKHLLTASLALPVLTSCGGGSPAVAAGGTDVAGEVTEGTTATGCVVTFNVAYTATPVCTVTPKSGLLAAFSYAISTTAITVTNTSTSGEVFDYICFGH